MSLGRKEYDEAISEYSKAIGEDPDFSEAYFNRGYAYYLDGEYDKAISDLNMLIRSDPNFALFYLLRREVYLKQGNNAQAQADFDRAKQLGYIPQ